jgi:hypothetical protein
MIPKEQEDVIEGLRAEIERWKVQHEEMLLKHAHEQHTALSALDEAMKEIERLKAKRDHWEHECKIAYQAFAESNVKKFYEETHQQDIEEHNRMMHEIAVLKALLTRAADALKYMEVNWPNEKKGDYDPLIRQLRKAAQ